MNLRPAFEKDRVVYVFTLSLNPATTVHLTMTIELLVTI